MIGQGNFSALRTSWDGVGGSVAGWARVCVGTGASVLRSTTVCEDGGKVVSYEMGGRWSRP
jgi:hypothetical protein